MKKYLLGLLVISLGLIAFSNAETINVSCSSDSECTPSTLNISPDICVNNETQLTLSNFSCEFEDESDTTCGLMFVNDDGNYSISIIYDNGEIVDNSCNINPNNNTYEVYVSTNAIFEGTVNNLILDNGGGNEGGNEGGDTGGNEGGDTGGNGSGLGLISHLTPAVNGLWDTVVELIPYIVYIGIGVLLFTLGFYAIRRLVNWITGKINSNFKSKR